MGWTPTLIVLGLSVGIAAWARTRSARPPVPGRVRYVPYTGILFLAVLTALLMLAHVLTLAGMPRGG